MATIGDIRTKADVSARNEPPAPAARPVAPSTSPADRDRMLEAHPALKAAAEAWARR